MTEETPVTDAATSLDLENIFSKSSLHEGSEMTTNQFLEILIEIMSYTIDRAREMLFRLLDLGRLALSNRYTLLLGADA